MKRTLIILIAIAGLGRAWAADKLQLDQRVRALAGQFQALQSQPEKRIPTNLLQQAQGVVLLDRTKAGVVFAYQGGGGVAMVRNPTTHAWGPVAFVTASEASLGLQIGGEHNFCVILLMTINATHLLTAPKFDFGGEARGTAGDVSSGVDASVAEPGPPMLVYGERQGLFGGAAVKGGTVTSDDEANRVYYEQYLTIGDILFGNKVQPTVSSKELAATLAAYASTARP
jgi:lipid-binding SYLF domain-containing protein